MVALILVARVSARSRGLDVESALKSLRLKACELPTESYLEEVPRCLFVVVNGLISLQCLHDTQSTALFRLDVYLPCVLRYRLKSKCWRQLGEAFHHRAMYYHLAS
eukprot:1978904-Amphidinium_carterae.1